MKKEWTKPKLVVLFRARADENVLGFCKLQTEGSGSADQYYSCNLYLIDEAHPELGCVDNVFCQDTPAS